MPKQLIINADDFGRAVDINRGIIKCLTGGVVTDISLLAVGDAFDDAVKRARENNIKKIGVHLTLTGPFKPAGNPGEVSSLVEKNGRFPASYAIFFAKYFTGLVKITEITSEFKKQISKVKEAGFKVTHIDSHQHIHMVPGILKIVIKLMKEENIGYVRLAQEKVDIVTKIKNPIILFRNLLLTAISLLSNNLLRASGVKHNNFFVGHIHAHKLKKENLIRAISGIKEGLTELGCHPGYFTDEIKQNHPCYKNSEEELEALCDKNVANEIKKRSIELISY